MQVGEAFLGGWHSAREIKPLPPVNQLTAFLSRLVLKMMTWNTHVSILGVICVVMLNFCLPLNLSNEMLLI